MGRHDSGYNLLFSFPYLVECLIRGFVPGDWIDRLDFKSLETVSEAHPRDNIGIRYDDMIWRLRWRGSPLWIYVYLMLEFQSTDEPFMAVRILDYLGGLYRKLVRALKLERGDLLSDPEHAGLRRAFALWLTEVLLPLRLPGVNVPKVHKLEEVSLMIAEHAIDWTAQWREEGRQEGEAALLLRLLRRKYGPLDPAIEERVHRADAARLLDWGERVLTADTLDEVFDGSRH